MNDEQSFPQTVAWLAADGFAQASAWIQTECARLGLRITGAIETQHLRAWSALLSVPTHAGRIYCKAAAPMYAYEPALTQQLAQWQPACILPVLALDGARGWMLLPDGGVSLRSLIQVDHDLAHWERVLVQYAALQMQASARTEELLALGVCDRRLAALPVHFARLQADEVVMLIGKPDGLTCDQYHTLTTLSSHFAKLCARLVEYSIRETLHHDDFHDGNILVCDGQYRIIDWAESAIAHPFFSFAVLTNNVLWSLQLPDDAREVIHLRDAYLEHWTAQLPRHELQAAFALAQRVARVNRALTWYHAYRHVSEAYKQSHAESVAGWAQAFLQGEAA